MSNGPRILITNDDGVDAPGLAVAIEIARQVSDTVCVVAPASNQSGVGHHLSFGVELEVEKRDRDVYAVPGTPADCVITGMTHPDLIADGEPDVVLSGVNHGQNLGDIIHCSGTLAGAREGTMQGALGVAMSQAVDFENQQNVDWACALTHGAAVLRTLLAKPRTPGIYFNVNFPLAPPETVAGVRVVPHQRFPRSPIAYYKSRNAGKFFVAIPNLPRDFDHDADFHILHHDRAITVTPLRLDQSNLAASNGLQAEFEEMSVAREPVKSVERDLGSDGGGDEIRYNPDPSATR